MLIQNKTKAIVTVIITFFCTLTGFGQAIPVDFETGGEGAAWTWTVFENFTNPPLEIVDNPDPTGVNCSETVAKFTALMAGNPWAGCETEHGADIGTWTVTEENKIITIMVWKPVISDVGIKLVEAGGGALPEIKIANTVTDEWEMITFDFTSHIGMTFDQIVIFPDFDLGGRTDDNVCYFDHIYGGEIEGCGTDGNVPVDYEEGGYGADWTWTVFENDTNPPVEIIDNPDAGGINCSPTVAKFIALQTGNPWAGCETNHGEDLGEVTITAENAMLNIMVWKPVISDVGIKLVEPGGGALPEIKIPNTLINEWELITFDFTAHIGMTYDQIVIFPDFDLAGRTMDNICYWDNIWGEEAIECEAEAAVPIDYEEDGYGADFTWTVFENDWNPPVEIIDNPDAGGINCSPTVAKFTALQTGNPWAGCETMHAEDLGSITITEENKLINIMVWKPVISDVGIKLVEPGGGALPEIKIPNTVINEWELITFDFTAHIGMTYDQIVIFPDFDLAGRTMDNICYWDNIWGEEAILCAEDPAIPIDYEEDGHGADFTWTVFENDTNPPVEIIENPDPSEVNCSATVAQFTALETGNPWAGCETMHGEDLGTITITEENKLINIMVWKPVISDVGIKLVEEGGGALPEIKIPNTLTNEWEVITFDFSAHVGMTYDQIVIFPDFDLDGRTMDNICYFDNIWGDSAVACPPTANAPVDYETDGYGADWTWTVFENDTNPPLEIIENPDGGGINCSPMVAQFTALEAGMPWAGVETMHGEGIGTFTIDEDNKLINIMVWKPVISDVGIKLVTSEGAALPEIKIPNTLINEWELMTFDFSDHIGGMTYDQIVIFPDFDLDGRTGDNICYIDNVWGVESIFCEDAPNFPIDHEVGGIGGDWTWTVFENDSNPALEIIDNPDSTDVNCTKMVAKFTALEAGNPWAGYESMHGDEGPGTWTIDDDNKLINIMVWKPVISDVGIKLVQPDGASLGEIKIANTLTDEWELLTFDFSSHIGMTFDQIVIFPDFDLDGRTGDNICYIDNIYGEDEYPCAPIDDTGVEEFGQSNVNLYPNPTSTSVTLTFANSFEGQVVITDVMGRSLIVENLNGTTAQIDLEKLPSTGIYFAKILNADGNVIEVKKFIYE